MEAMVTRCGGCGAVVHIRTPEAARRWACPRCRTGLVEARSAGSDSTQAAPASHRARPVASPRLACLLTILAVLLGGLGGSLVASIDSDAERTASVSDLAPSAPPLLRESNDPPALAATVLERWKEPVAKGLKAVEPGPPDARSRIVAASAPAATAADDPSNLAGGAAVARLLAVRDDLRPDQAETEPKTAGDDSRDGLGPVPVLTPPDFGAPSSEALSAACPSRGAPRFAVRGDDGRTEVARFHGHRDGKTVVILPDGRLGVLSMVVPTTAPFVPLSGDEVERRARTGPFATFQVHRTPHYVLLYQSSLKFAEKTGDLLEELYRRLLEAFRKHDVPVHEAEFPLVAVVFRHERDFREYRRVDADVRAYYEIFSNRIFLFENADREGAGPEVSALLTTQTAAHEGTHQILQNIGVQPRLGGWPLWLAEGLAEYCASPASTRRGEPTWNGLGQINSLHMATLRELDDPVSLAMKGPDDRVRSMMRKPDQPVVERLLRQSEMTPTDYALAWALTHFLALKRGPEFTRFLSVMGQAAPLEPRSPDDHVRQFRESFGDDLAKLDKTVDAYLRKLSRQKGYDPLPYYAVMFEQPIPPGVVRRAAMVSQSPQLIRQWVQELTSPGAGVPSWQAVPHPTRQRARILVQNWMSGY